MISTNSTIYHTPSGDIEVPDCIATYESNLAPKWLVFPEHIINTNRIRNIYTVGSRIIIVCKNNNETIDIQVKNSTETFKFLQKVFADGVPPKQKE